MSNLLQINPKKRNMFIRFCLILGLCIGTYYLGTQSKNNPNMSNLLNAKDEIIFELNNKYNKLAIEHEKSQALIKATTDEVKRLAQELKEYKNNPQVELIFNESNNNLGVAIVSDHIKANEAFSSMAYCDSDDKYRNGYGTLATMITYKVGDTVKLRNCKGKVEVVTATKNNQILPERFISEEEALERKKAHLIKHVFPYLYGKRFTSPEEFIVATDVIYNRGIAHSKSLFNSDGTINCKSLYNYMDHSKKAYQRAMRKRYAKNYALCIQS